MMLSARAALLLFFVSFARAVSLPVVESRSGAVRTETIRLAGLDGKHQYSLLYSVAPLSGLAVDARVTVEVVQDGTIITGKVLHAGDPDFYTQFRVPKPGPAAVRVVNTGARGKYTLQVNRWPLADSVRSGPIRRWQDAMEVKLGTTVIATGDDTPYIPLPGTPRKAISPDAAPADWYRFEFRESSPKLVHIQVDLTERDQIPVHVTLHRVKDAKLEEYYEGEDPVSLPHEVQALPGNKFTPRILKEPGTYYIAVRANHPEYKLRTRVYDPPPYTDPQTAVRTAMDYILSAGDSWHANTPRRGGILDRTEAVHQETSLCVACHVTHFSQRAYLYANRNGYEVNTPQQLQFLTERFYNNPRPFYGFEEQGAVWARMISAPANVLSRMSHLMSIFEDQVSHERRERFHKGIAEYLRIYYDGRDKLPPDETNGNTPLVSAHEVAWYSWGVTRDPKIPELVAAGEVKNTIDLCYQTLALADMDREKYAGLIRRNVERLFELQRPDGQWSARFEPAQPAVEFQTGHALWALHAAGVPATEPHVAKGLKFLLSRQQPFGGWMDPLQSFENFRTPFRETQMSILALSAYYPKPGRAKGWNSPALKTLSEDPVELLHQLDSVWDPPSPQMVEAITAAADSNDVLIRQAAVEALGRLGRAPSPALLGDPSKLVQRTAAWAMRQAYVRHPDLELTPLSAALTNGNDRVRWGATRVFAAHFSELAQHGVLAQPLARLASSDAAPLIRMDAVKGLWQFWFWSPDMGTRAEIEDALIAAVGQPVHPWVARNLRYAVYNLADENIRYLYNNWVPLLARQEDRERSIKGRLAVESRLGNKFARALESGSATQKKELLRALTELPLRRADVYDLEADLHKPAPPVYNRIGNDIEQIAFFGESAERMARALKPLLASEDPEMRTLTSQGVLLVRETRFADVNRLAGPAGENTKAVLAKIESIPEAAEVARALKPAPVTVAVAGTAGSRPVRKVKLDEAFFRGYVQPILEKRGKDGYACVHCHASHTLFNGTYGTALNVVNPDQPEQSLLLLKPTSSSESEGVVGTNSVAHGGGVRWPQGSPEYVTILDWIKGAKE
jgi:hypothetical protein